MTHFQSARFLTSASKLEQCPPDEGAEVAFAGRSNAGKSSCINTLTAQSKLARTSKTPGRTQLINFFTLDPQTRLVDLPGYGFAQVPLEVKQQWQQELGRYLRERLSLKGLVLLMDIRHPLQPFDEHMIEWARSNNLPLHIVLTKADKLNRAPAQQTLLAVQKQLAGTGASIQLFSSLKKSGVEELREKLTTWLAG